MPLPSVRFRKQVNTYFKGIGFALLISAASCEAEPPRVVETRPQAVRVIGAQDRLLVHRTAYVGTVRSAREVKVLGRVAGTLTDLPIAEGKHAERGAVLARIDAPDVAARADQARAERERAAAERDYACETFATEQKLYEGGAISAAELDRSRRQCRSGEAAVRAASAQTRELAGRLTDRTERAAFAGRVLEHLAEPGEYVTPGRPLVLMGDGVLELEVAVSERDVAHPVAHGETVDLRHAGRASVAVDTEVEVHVPGGQITSRVASVAPRADGPSRTFLVRIPLPPDIGVRHGMSLDVDFILERSDEETTVVPVEAIVRDQQGAALFLVEGDVVRRHSVTTGIAEKGWVAVTSPLPPGARVAVSNLDVLHDGAAIYPVAVGTPRR
jgi:membrane fusion protein, multidrug efflux system